MVEEVELDMTRTIDLQALLGGCANDSFDDGIRIDTELEPVSGPGGPVKPAAYEGGRYQEDRRWASPDDAEPTQIVVIDNVPSQANRLEDALRRHRASTLVPELILDLSEVANLPAHLPRSISSLQFPHRNADAYLRDAQLGGKDFPKTELGKAIFGATAQECGPLMAWFPQALLYGFWQSHLGKKRPNSKHARAWVSEIVGWNPAATDTRVQGLKGDPLNLSVDSKADFDENDLLDWKLLTDEKKTRGGKKERLSEIGHGQALLKTGEDGTPAAVSFVRVTQRATVSFAQLRRIALAARSSGAEADAAARALLVALGLQAHVLAFGRGFALRSGAELRPSKTTVTWLGSEGDEPCALGDAQATGTLVRDARKKAKSLGVPLDGWEKPAMLLTPKANLLNAIRATWPELAD